MFENSSYAHSAHRAPLSTQAIIHLFALAHAVVAIASRAMHYYDDVPLTVLTISMVVIISIRHRLQIEITSIVTLIASFVGFLAGVYGGLIMRILLKSDLWGAALTTFLITEILGWGIYFIARSRNNDKASPAGWTSTSTWIILTATVILVLRVGYILILRHFFAEQEGLYNELDKLFSNTFALLLLLCGNLICVHLYISNRHRFPKRWIHPLWTVGSIGAVSLLTTLCVLFEPWFKHQAPLTTTLFFRMWLIILLVSIAAYALLYIGHHVVISQRELSRERRQRHLAQYQYSKFKQQINPHFLFNSLNILDALVQEGESERASSFIRKLAGIYRYMLRNEEEPLVSLREEVAFTEMYIDLIKERFPNGLEIHRKLNPEHMNRLIVPCSLQQLVENATKHNIISAEEPLCIRIESDEEWLRVENNLQPRISQRQNSTRLGLKTISQQYLDIADRSISIEQTDQYFRVSLPLLKPSKP